MAVTTREGIMVIGGWSAQLDWSPLVQALLLDDDEEPLDLHALLYGPDGRLVCPPMVYTHYEGGTGGILIGGPGMLTHLGGGGIGPRIIDRDYPSGHNMLDNGSFVEGDLHWRRPSEGSLWVPGTGVVTNAGGLTIDDVLEYDRKFPARPGQRFALVVTGVTGTGRIRARVLYEGAFTPPNLIATPAWVPTSTISVDGTQVTLGPIPKPQYVTPFGPSWTLGPTFTAPSGAVLVAGPNPKPDLVVGFSTGTEWSTAPEMEFVGGELVCSPIPWPVMEIPLEAAEWTNTSLYPGDMRFEDGILLAGPVTRKQIILNPSFDMTAELAERREHPGPSTASEMTAAHGIAVHEDDDPVVAYLRRYGYLHGVEGQPDEETLELALEEFQRFTHLEVTGVADEATLEMMARPRCGFPDRLPPGDERGWVYIGTRWEGVTHLKWYLHSPGPFTQSEMAGIMVEAFTQWENTGAPLTFEETSNQSEAHIVIFWNTSPNQYGALAYAWQPPGPGQPLVGTNNGDVTFNTDIVWRNGPAVEPEWDILPAALHELGHALGLNHSDQPDVVMNMTLGPRRTLAADDIAGIEAIYAGVAPPPPGPGDPGGGGSLAYWYMNGVDAFGGTHDPDPGLFYWHPTDGLDAGPGATTDGAAYPYQRKYLRADPVAGGGADEHPVAPGESYRGEAVIRFSPDVNDQAEAWISLVIPHPTDLPQGMKWHGSRKVTPSDEAERRIPVEVEVTMGPGRDVLNPLFEVHRHSTGYITVDEFFVYRTRGNSANLAGNNSYPLVEGVDYRLSADVTSVEDQQVGDVALQAHIYDADTEVIEIKEQAQGHTDLYTLRVDLNFTAPDDAVAMQPFLHARDIIGQPFQVANLRLYRTSNNRRRIHRSAFDITPNQKYTLGADVTSDASTQGGTVTVGAVIFGPGKTPQIKTVTYGVLDDEDPERKETTVTPPDGYTQCELFIDAMDVRGGAFRVRNLSFVKADNNTDVTVGPTFDILPDERYRADALVVAAPETTHGSMSVGVRLTGDGQEDREELFKVEVTEGEAIADGREVKPPPGYTHAAAIVRSKDVEGGTIEVSGFTFVKMDNNSDAAAGGTTRTVTPERGYRWTEMVQAAAGLTRGTVKLAVTGTGPGRPPWIHESSTMDMTEDVGSRKQIIFEFTPPSGYGVLAFRIIGTDVEGGTITVSEGDMRDTDRKTVVHDAWLDSPVGGARTVESDAPEGTEWVMASVVAEGGTGPWSVDAVSLARIGIDPTTGDDIVADVLVDPDTGQPLSIVAGDINCPEVIPNDLRIQNMTLLALLNHYCTVVAEPRKEFRLTATAPPALDVGTPEDVFPDHAVGTATPVVVATGDFRVGEMPPVRVDMEDRATAILVAGTEPRTVSGRPVLITATAVVPGRQRLDWNGRPLNRTRPVSDAAVDHRGYAAALAEDLARAEALPSRTFSLTFSGTSPRPEPGSWIYVHHPAGRLEDRSNPVPVRGVMTYPQRVRVLERAMSLGTGHHIIMRRPDGSTFELPGVLWANESATVLTVGNHRPEWRADPQGPSTATQYLRDRLSTPR